MNDGAPLYSPRHPRPSFWKWLKQFPWRRPKLSKEVFVEVIWLNQEKGCMVANGMFICHCGKCVYESEWIPYKKP